MRSFCLLLLGLVATATAIPSKIVGGDVTTIAQYPHMVSLLFTSDGSTYWQKCGGTIINTRSILTAAHCTEDENRPNLMRARVGSTWANSGGVVHAILTITNHPEYNRAAFMDADISIVRTPFAITLVNNAVQPGAFAGPNYNLDDNAVVWAAGWGYASASGEASEQLRHVQVWTVNQATCAQLYTNAWVTITDNMLCSGYPGVGGRDQCAQDAGSPLYHNGIVVGVCSFGVRCGDPDFPGVNTRVSRFIPWIQAYA